MFMGGKMNEEMGDMVHTVGLPEASASSSMIVV